MLMGAATTLINAGFNEIQIKCIGGWSSQAYALYIREIQNRTNHLGSKTNSLTININTKIRASCSQAPRYGLMPNIYN